MVLQGGGFGSLSYGFFGKALTSDNIPTLMRHTYAASISLQEEKQVEDLMGQKSGSSQIIEFLETRITPTITCSLELVGKQELEMLNNEKFQTTSNYSVLDNSGIGITEEVQFDANGEIDGTTLIEPFTGKVAADILVNLIDTGNNDSQTLTVVSGAPAADNTEVELNATTNKLINTGLANRGAILSVKKTISSINTLGFEATKAALGKLDFVGVFTGPRWKYGLLMVVQGLQNTQGFTIQTSDGKNPVELVMRAATPAGRRKSVYWGELPNLFA